VRPRIGLPGRIPDQCGAGRTGARGHLTGNLAALDADRGHHGPAGWRDAAWSGWIRTVPPEPLGQQDCPDGAIPKAR
jgi:hypothetical protein